MAGVGRLSTHEIMMVSRETFSKLSSDQQRIDLSTIQKFFDSSQFNLSGEEIKDIELALVLIASAHDVSEKNFDDAGRLLNLCAFLSSYKGNSVQRVVHYFTKALQERIARETGMTSSESKERNLFYPSEPTEDLDPVFVSCCLQLPCVQVSQFAAIQAVTESLTSAKKVHFIDIAIGSGVHCPVLMQALANRQECPVEFLKITAVGLPERKKKTEEIGKCLTCLAETLNLRFSFSIVMIVDIEDLKKENFEISNDEAVAVLSLHGLRYVRAVPEFLKSFSTFLRNLNPSVLVNVDTEANHSSPIFINRFHESLLCYSAFYDCIQAYVNQGYPNRLRIEAIVGQKITETLATKDEEISFRDMKIDEWRAYFTGFGMIETEVSISSFNQATQLQKNFAAEESGLLVRNGKCLVIGWKGTPFFSVSAWKFQQGLSQGLCVRKKVK